MRYKMICLLGLVLAGLFLSGCATSNLTRLDDVSSDKAIAVAKFRVIYNDKDVTKGCGVIFNNTQPGIMFDESGYVFAKLPIGTNSIRNVIHKSGLMHHRFRSEELTCQLCGGGVINYIGDITFDWHGMGSGSGFAIAAISPILSATVTGGGAVVSVESNAAEAQEAFQQKFSTNRSVTPSLLVVKPRQ